ncbi:MAG: nuclear transport factor 2 family protein [Dyadobacter sp.]
MDLPEVIKDLIIAQNEHDSKTFAGYFSENAVVHDEGEIHHGREEIRLWNEATNAKYQTMLKPLDFVRTEENSILSVLVSGNFTGSPITLKYVFKMSESKITSLQITD